eukprot:g2614.t1
MALEEAFDIELPDEETTPLKNCGDVMESRVEMVAGLLQSNEVEAIGFAQAHEAHLPFLLHFLAEHLVPVSWVRSWGGVQLRRHHLSGAGLCRVSGTERASRLSRCALELDVVAPEGLVNSLEYRELLRRAGQGSEARALSALRSQLGRQYNQLPSPSAGHVSVSRPGAAARTPAAVRHALHRWLRGGAAPVHEASEAFTEMAMEMANAWKIAQEKVQDIEDLAGKAGRRRRRPASPARYSNPADDPRSKDHSQEAEMEIDRGRSLERMWVKKHVGLGALNWAGALAAVRGQCRPGFAKLRRMTPAAQYAAFFGTDAEKACDALVSDLLKDEDDAGETDEIRAIQHTQLVPSPRCSFSPPTRGRSQERRSPSGPPGLILSTTSAPNSLSSPSYFGAEQFRKNLALTLEDECLDDDARMNALSDDENDCNFAGEIGEATAPESFQMFYPPVVAPPLGRGEEYDAWLAQLPSIGSANHFFGTCDRCCFHPKGRCHNGYNCQHCHYDHEKRKRKSKKKSTEREDLAHSIPATPPALGLMGPLEHCYPIPAPFPEPGAPVPPVPPGLPGLQAYPPWYPEPVPPDFIPPESHHAPAWEDYVLRLEEENRYLRGMLMQYGASLPPSVIPSHRGPQPMPAIASPVDPVSLNPMNPMLSPSAVPFCLGWSTDATREPVGSALPEMAATKALPPQTGRPEAPRGSEPAQAPKRPPVSAEHAEWEDEPHKTWQWFMAPETAAGPRKSSTATHGQPNFMRVSSARSPLRPPHRPRFWWNRAARRGPMGEDLAAFLAVEVLTVQASGQKKRGHGSPLRARRFAVRRPPMAASVDDWLEAYVTQYEHFPQTPEQLCAYAKNHGHHLRYAAARRAWASRRAGATGVGAARPSGAAAGAAARPTSGPSRILQVDEQRAEQRAAPSRTERPWLDAYVDRMQDLAAAQQQGAADARHSDGASSSLKGDGSCTSTCTTRADAEYTIDIEKEVDKLIEDPSRPRRFKCTRGKEKKKDSNQPIIIPLGPGRTEVVSTDAWQLRVVPRLGFLPCRPEGDSVSSGLAAYRARGLATLQAIEMHDKPSSLWRGLDRRDRQGDAGLSAYRAHGLATLQAMEAGYEEGPWAPVYSGVGWYSGQPEADWMADWMAAGGTAVLVPAGQVSIAQAPQARKESVWKERAQACGTWPVMDNEMPVVGADGPTAQLFGYGSAREGRAARQERRCLDDFDTWRGLGAGKHPRRVLARLFRTVLALEHSPHVLKQNAQRNADLANVVYLRFHSVLDDWTTFASTRISAVFIDAAHDYASVRHDLDRALALPEVHSIVLDDYGTRTGVHQAVHEVLQLGQATLKRYVGRAPPWSYDGRTEVLDWEGVVLEPVRTKKEEPPLAQETGTSSYGALEWRQAIRGELGSEEEDRTLILQVSEPPYLRMQCQVNAERTGMAILRNDGVVLVAVRKDMMRVIGDNRAQRRRDRGHFTRVGTEAVSFSSRGNTAGQFRMSIAHYINPESASFSELYKNRRGCRRSYRIIWTVG